MMRILSGIQPTGYLHIGNYLGAIKQWTELQKAKNLDKETGCIFMVVDLHALTVAYDPKQLQKRILDIVLDYLALGVDYQKNTIFVQSQIKEHAELAWLLETITPMGELERMTQYKDKSKENKDNINAGLFAYPVLMAADILLYKTTIVPVGDDQAQHVEITREIARKFNNKFGQTFPEPKTQLRKIGARIMSLADPLQKMSKSISQGCIFLNDSEEKIREKIKTAVTDSGKEVKFDEINKPAISNLLTIYHLFSEKPIEEIEEEYEGKGYGDFKKDLADVVVEKLKEFQEKRKEFEKNPELVKKILAQGAKKAQTIAEETMAEVKTKMGLI
ncbi:MAG: tryptophan--tRNA ligase [Patescibacteria group bacterium]